jgi:AcrR family transcriptional regulator
VPTARPGRKRSEETRLAILTAVIDLLDEIGYAGLTIEGIAARSGAGKQTIYRWWPSKADVLLDGLATKADLHVPIEDTGSYRTDLRAFLDATFGLARQELTLTTLRALMAEAQIDERFGEHFRTAFLQRRRDALQAILDRAAARGDLPPTPSPDLVLDIVFGTLWYRVLATRAPLSKTLTNDLLRVLIH